jgi:putative DNA primase/helicase
VSKKDSNPFRTAALEYAAEGWRVFPCAARNKNPLTERGVNDATTDVDTILRWWTKWPDANVAIAMGEIIAIDVDPRHGGDESLAYLERQHGPLSATRQASTGGGGRHFFFRPNGTPIRNSNGKLGEGLDVKSLGGYVVAPPSIHPSGKKYEWANRHEVLDLPHWLAQKLANLASARAKEENASANGTNEAIPDGQRNSALASLAGSMRKRGATSESIEAALLEDNRRRCRPPLPEAEVRTIAASVGRYEPGATLDPELINDSANADRLVEAEGADLRYCFELKSWLVWDGRRWAVDVGQRSRALMEQTMRTYVQQIIAATKNVKVMVAATRCLDTHRITNGLREAEKKRGINAAKLDTHRFLLTFTNGTLDLQTGQLGPHEREHLITKMIHHPYNPEAKCPRWLEFIRHAMEPDAASYLQKVVGYAMTGDTSEKKFFVIVGEGDTGKTTLLNVLRTVFREYAVLLQVDTLLDRFGSDGATQEDLASLRGVRLATTSELDQGRRLSVATIKRICQGMGEITASAKYMKKITFAESHKLFIDTNHLPLIPVDEQPLWNRLIVFVFGNPVPKHLQNRRLNDDLVRDEAEGIIAWAVEGNQRRGREGLDDVPDSFQQAKLKWREKMDSVKEFLREECVVQEDLREWRTQAYEAYVNWQGRGRSGAVISPRAFTERLESLGHQRTDDRRYYLGFSLKKSGGVSVPKGDANLLLSDGNEV